VFQKSLYVRFNRDSQLHCRQPDKL
jgi:hypothetical protein